MNKQQLEGTLEEICSLETYTVYELPQGTGERKHIFTKVIIMGRDNKPREIRFNGIISSDSIGHHVTYTESINLWTDSSKEYVQELFDSELGREYIGSYRAKPTNKEGRNTLNFMSK